MAGSFRRVAFAPVSLEAGSAILARLPAGGEGAALPEQPTQPFPRPGRSTPERCSPVIVVVDDSLTVRTILEVGLEREGFEVYAFGDGPAFFRWLVTPQARIPDLLLLDVLLPRLDGYAIARSLRANPAFTRTVLVFVSRKDGVIDRVKGRLLGAAGYLTKPFQIQEVVALVNEVLDSRADALDALASSPQEGGSSSRAR